VGRIGACGLVEKPAATKIICARLQQPLVAGGEYAFRALHRLNPGPTAKTFSAVRTTAHGIFVAFARVFFLAVPASCLESVASCQPRCQRMSRFGPGDSMHPTTLGLTLRKGTITTSRPSPKVQHYRRASCLLSSQKQIHRLGLLVGKIAIASSRSVYERRLPGKFSQVWKASSKVNSWAR